MVKKEDVLTILKSNNVNQDQIQAIETQIADLQTKYDEIRARMSILDTTIHS
jgi:prefoldin subunit 5